MVENLYLPPYSQCSMDFMLQVLSEKKGALKRDKINAVELPKFGEFAMKNLVP